MSIDGKHPSQFKSELRELIGKNISGIYRFGFLRESYIEKVMKKDGEEELLRAHPGFLAIKLEDGRVLSFLEIEEQNSVRVYVMDQDDFNELGSQETYGNVSFREINFPDELIRKRLGGEYKGVIKDISIIRQKSKNVRYRDTLNEIGVVIKLAAPSSINIAVGANLAPRGGFGVVLLLNESEIDLEWVEGYELLDING